MMYDITPVPKPRMTQRDKWLKPARPRVARYRAFKQEVQLKIRIADLNHNSITFAIPMPNSWSSEKRDRMRGKPHTQVPDLDNLLKALCDALYGDDSGIHTIRRLQKIWADTGAIWIVQE